MSDQAQQSPANGTQFPDSFYDLTQPFLDFEVEAIEVKDKRSGGVKVLYYASKFALENRLDNFFGPERWHRTFADGPHALICTISAVMNVAGEDIPIPPKTGVYLYSENLAAPAEVAFRRAGFDLGVGRYLCDYGVPEFASSTPSPSDVHSNVAVRPMKEQDAEYESQEQPQQSHQPQRPQGQPQGRNRPQGQGQGQQRPQGQSYGNRGGGQGQATQYGQGQQRPQGQGHGNQNRGGGQGNYQSQGNQNRGNQDNRGNQGQEGGQNQSNDLPRSGKALFAWLKKIEESNDNCGIIRYLNGWAKAEDINDRMVTWTNDQVSFAVQEACRKLEENGIFV